MASTMSKRQQARNERQLQDLIRTVPGNDRCADCGAKNPGWASWNLGLFLCMRCAALHRKLGTHISKVKSLSMDSWSNDQVDNMKSVGNVVGNQLFNPRNVKAQMPVDIDEVDAALEKYIRQKYEQRAFLGGNAAQTPVPTRQNTGSTGSWSEEPAALPPKPGRKFGFSLRSSSSTFPRAQKNDRSTPPLTPIYNGNDRSNDVPSPTRPNKPSQLFGMRITSVANNFDAKLSYLRDMGFSDNKRNTEVLKKSDGNVEQAVETLVRLGEGTKPPPRTVTPVSASSPSVQGLSVDKTRQPEPKKSSTDPWEVRENVAQRAATQPAPGTVPPRSQSVGPPSNSWNPFLSQTASVLHPPAEQNLVDNFQSMQLSQTGPAMQQYGQQTTQPWTSYQNDAVQASSNPWQTQQATQQVATSPMYGQQYQQQAVAQDPAHSANPFLRSSRSQVFASSNPWAHPVQAASPPPQQQQQQNQAALNQQGANPFGVPWQQQSVFQQSTSQSPAPIYGNQPEYFVQQNQAHYQDQQILAQAQQQQGQSFSPFGGQNPYQQPPPQQQNQVLQQSQQMPTQSFLPFSGQNPYQQPPSQQQQMLPQQTSMPYQTQLQAQNQSAPMAQQLYAQPTRHDKNSIMALYGHSQNSPFQPLQTLPEDGSQQALPQRSATMPVTSMNPFGAPPPSSQPPTSFNVPRHVSNESVDFLGMGRGGRQSPDAFANLSASYVR